MRILLFFRIQRIEAVGQAGYVRAKSLARNKVDSPPAIAVLSMNCRPGVQLVIRTVQGCRKQSSKDQGKCPRHLNQLTFAGFTRKRVARPFGP